MSIKTAIIGNGYYCKSFDEVKYFEQSLICLNEEGIITQVIEPDDVQYHEKKEALEKANLLRLLRDDEILLPGFIDLHIHGPQWAQAGTALDRPLEVWLNEYTFPLEAKFKDLNFAKKVYGEVVEETLKNGTTTAVYFATVDKEPSLELAKICGDKGQRAFVGKVAMDEEGACPEYYKDKDSVSSIESTELFVEEMFKIQDNYKQKVYPIVTPRFIPTCTNASLEGLGLLAKRYDLAIQTHASESDWAHGYVKEKMGMNDTLALDGFDLLTNKSIIAHAPFLEDEDIKVMASSGATIAHCPLSNAYFANAVLPVKEFMKKGIRIGLATDISGGYSPSMYSAIRQTVISSKMLEDGVNPGLGKEERGRKDAALTLNNAMYLATIGGGKALDLPLGRFEVGYIFDAQIVNVKKNIPHFYDEKHEDDLLHKVLLLAQTNNINEVWVQGERVYKR